MQILKVKKAKYPYFFLLPANRPRYGHSDVFEMFKTKIIHQKKWQNFEQMVENQKKWVLCSLELWEGTVPLYFWFSAIWSRYEPILILSPESQKCLFWAKMGHFWPQNKIWDFENYLYLNGNKKLCQYPQYHPFLTKETDLNTLIPLFFEAPCMIK